MVTAWPDVKELSLDASTEFMVIACDGIWDCLENQQLVDILRPKILANK